MGNGFHRVEDQQVDLGGPKLNHTGRAIREKVFDDLEEKDIGKWGEKIIE